MNPLTLFSGPYAMLARIALVAIILIAAFTAGWVKGNDHGTQKLTDYIGKQAEESAKIVVKQGAATERVVTKYVKVKGDTKVITKTQEKEVVKYVEGKPLTLACQLDNRWVRLHDAAALGTVPPPAGGDDGTPGAVSAADALPTITKNYAVANRNANKVEFCQNWVREQFKAMNGKALE